MNSNDFIENKNDMKFVKGILNRCFRNDNCISNLQEIFLVITLPQSNTLYVSYL